MDRIGKLSISLLASFRLLGVTLVVTAIGLAAPVRADTLAAQATATLTIHIERLSPRGGVLRLGVYDADHYPDDKSAPLASADVPASQDVITVTLKDLPPGRYAIESFQDLNANGKMDTGLFGFPLEPYGFSRDARPFLSKPDFDAVAFNLAPGDNSQNLHLQNSHAAVSAGF